MAENQDQFWEDDICIVGRGCVLPSVNDVGQFWETVIEGESVINEICDKRWNNDFVLDKKNRQATDKTYSRFGGEITPDQMEGLAKELGVNFEDYNPVDVISIEATRQVLSECKVKDSDRIGLYAGNMNPDETFYACQFFSEAPKIEEFMVRLGYKSDDPRLLHFREFFERKLEGWEPEPRHLLQSGTLKKIRDYFGLNGQPSALFDSACASSLTAIEVAINKLRLKKIDVAIAGGIERNLSIGTFVMFCKVGALSAGRCKPFDTKTDGLSQGEGSVLYALKRLADAVKDGDKIFGVIRSCVGGSDGKSGSLFQPTVSGQVRVYKKAYEQFSNRRVDFIEAHGTGTQIGDTTEINSLGAFFEDFKIPVGSVKSIFGHTKSAAGASSLLKCILSMENGVIPPSKYIERPMKPAQGNIHVNKKPIKLKKRSTPYRMGVSSIGFGGINYHLVVDEYKSDFPVSKREDSVGRQKILISPSVYVEKEEALEGALRKYHKIPPKSLAQIDESQLVCLYAAFRLFEEIGVDYQKLPKEQVSVISTSLLGIEHLVFLTKRIVHTWICREFEKELTSDPDFIEDLIKYKDGFPMITEDSGPGILNNVIAGRICNAMDFQGRNFNVDMDKNSLSAALDIIKENLELNGGCTLVVSMDEDVCLESYEVKRRGAKAALVFTEEFAQRFGLPAEGVLESIDFSEGAT